MDTGRKPPLISFSPVIKGLYPAHPVKAIERATGCTPRQAQRMVETGRVPAHLYGVVVAFLRESAEFNRRRLEEINEGIERLAQVKAAAAAASNMGGDPARAPLGDAREVETALADGDPR